MCPRDHTTQTLSEISIAVFVRVRLPLCELRARFGLSTLARRLIGRLAIFCFDRSKHPCFHAAQYISCVPPLRAEEEISMARKRWSNRRAKRFRRWLIRPANSSIRCRMCSQNVSRDVSLLCNRIDRIINGQRTKNFLCFRASLHIKIFLRFGKMRTRTFLF